MGSVSGKPVLYLILQRQSGGSHRYQFELHLQVVKKMVMKGRIHDHCVILREMDRNAPCLVLMRAEEQNWLTFLQTATKKQYMNVVTVTEDDDATSLYGKSKVRACLRPELDCVFFAGPCTGGSAWNRLNRTISNEAAAQVERHKRLYWNLWGRFADALEHVFSIDACALTELPRSCEYWNDERATQLVNGTESHTHITSTEACVVSLRNTRKARRLRNYGGKIVSWGVHFQALKKICDGRHQHVPCAGRDTRVTQLYTFNIAQTVIETLNKRVMSLWKKRRVTSRAPRLQDWSSLPHPLLQKECLSNEASLSKKFDRIIQAVRESKKKELNIQPFS